MARLTIERVWIDQWQWIRTKQSHQAHAFRRTQGETSRPIDSVNRCEREKQRTLTVRHRRKLIDQNERERKRRSRQIQCQIGHSLSFIALRKGTCLLSARCMFEQSDRADQLKATRIAGINGTYLFFTCSSEREVRKKHEWSFSLIWPWLAREQNDQWRGTLSETATCSRNDLRKEKGTLSAKSRAVFYQEIQCWSIRIIDRIVSIAELHMSWLRREEQERMHDWIG